MADISIPRLKGLVTKHPHHFGLSDSCALARPLAEKVIEQDESIETHRIAGETLLTRVIEQAGEIERLQVGLRHVLSVLPPRTNPSGDLIDDLANQIQPLLTSHGIVEEQDAEIERLRTRELQQSDLIRTYTTEGVRQRERISALEEALRPFAEVLKGNYSNQPDCAAILCGLNEADLRLNLSLGDFRRAASLLAQKEKS